MTKAIVLSDNGVSSGSAGLKTSGSNDGILALQTSTAGGTATTAVTINTSQNVGIGTTSPAVRLHLTGDNPFIRFDDNSGGSQQDYEVGSESALFKIKNVGQATEPLVIDNSGNVGIGTSTPTQRLDVDRGASNGVVAKFGRSGGQAAFIYADANYAYFGSDAGISNGIGDSSI